MFQLSGVGRGPVRLRRVEDRVVFLEALEEPLRGRVVREPTRLALRDAVVCQRDVLVHKYRGAVFVIVRHPLWRAMR